MYFISSRPFPISEAYPPPVLADWVHPQSTDHRLHPSSPGAGPVMGTAATWPDSTPTGWCPPVMLVGLDSPH